MSVIASYIKAPASVLDFQIDWTAWLGTDTISSSTWVASTGITINSNSFTTTTATVWLAGGTVGLTYTLTNTIVTAGGRTDQRDILISIQN